MPSRLKEQKLWDAMRDNKPPTGCWLTRVENSVAEGMGDVYVVAPGHTCWVELKSITPPKRATTRYMGDEGVRTSQKNWHKKFAMHGGVSWVLIRDREDYSMLLLIPGRLVDEINEMPLSELRLHSQASNWPGIFSIITGQLRARK